MSNFDFFYDVEKKLKKKEIDREKNLKNVNFENYNNLYNLIIKRNNINFKSTFIFT